MSDFTIVEKLPQAEEYNWLREQIGWRTNPEDVIRRALPNSLYGVCAYRAGRLVGMARVIGDAGLVYYIQDVIVVPECQRQGIGTQMMDRVMSYIREHASLNMTVGLMSAKGKEPFYEKYGFTVRPTEKLGAGMTIFWKT